MRMKPLVLIRQSVNSSTAPKTTTVESLSTPILIAYIEAAIPASTNAKAMKPLAFHPVYS